MVSSCKNTLAVWDVDASVKLFEIGETPIRPVFYLTRLSPDEKRLAVPTSKGIAIWDVTAKTQVGAWEPPGFDHIETMEWSPDGTRLLATYIEMTGPTNATTRNANSHCYLLDDFGNTVSKVVGNSAEFSQSGDRIATVYGNCCILDGKTGKLLTRIRGSNPRESIIGGRSMHFSPNGNYLFANGSAAVFKRVRPEWWYSVLKLPAYWGTIFFLVFLIRELMISQPTNLKRSKA